MSEGLVSAKDSSANLTATPTPLPLSGEWPVARQRLPVFVSLDDLDIESSAYQAILDRVEDGVYLVDRNKRVRLWNAGAEALTGFSRAEVLGQPCGNHWLCHVDYTGRTMCSQDCPIERTFTTESSNEHEAYLQHKLGHRVPVRIRSWPLRNRQGQVVGAIEVFRPTAAGRRQEQLIEELSHLALIDDLTHVPNRRHFDLQLDRRLAELNRFGWPFGVLMIDLDLFKQVNDGHGHHVGDQVLHLVARTLLSNCRSLDTVARWGGEEFAAIIANVREEELRKVAEKFRAMVEASGLRESSSAPVRVTVSIGGAMARPNEPAGELMKRADDMLYTAKRTGRNRVCL
jgi:diguanylate cyclase (GGDEF)-like protein/PAS domain S-box-containing protein